jgi:hypothetical protein
VGLLGLVLATWLSPVFLVVGAALAGAGHGLAFPAAQDDLTRIAPDDQRAEVSAALCPCISLGATIPVIGIGVLAAVFSLFAAVAVLRRRHGRDRPGHRRLASPPQGARMTTAEQLAHPETIAGSTYGTDRAARSPLTMDDLARLEAAAGLTDDDDRYLRMAGDVLADQAADMVDTWRGMLAGHPHLAVYSAHPDGTPNTDYSAASHPRFARWVIDACTRPRDREWLDYQHEIGLRHTRQKKNLTDHADAVDHIPLRYFLAFTGPIIASTRDFLARKGHSPEDVDRMHAAWTKAVLLHMTLWTRPYVAAEDW